MRDRGEITARDLAILSNTLWRLRKYHGLTQHDLGKRVYVTADTIRKYEKGEVTPYFDTIENLCRIFDIRLDTLVDSHFDIWDYAKTHKPINRMK